MFRVPLTWTALSVDWRYVLAKKQESLIDEVREERERILKFITDREIHLFLRKALEGRSNATPELMGQAARWIAAHLKMLINKGT